MAMVGTGLTIPADDCYVAYHVHSPWLSAGEILAVQGGGVGQYRNSSSNSTTAPVWVSNDAGGLLLFVASEVGSRWFIARTGSAIRGYVDGVPNDAGGGFPTDLFTQVELQVDDNYVDPDTVTVGTLSNESQQARHDWADWAGRLGKTHPAIAEFDKLIDNAGGTAPGFILAPGVPGAAAVGDALLADQASDPIAHGEAKLGASILSDSPLGSFGPLRLDTDGSNDHVNIGEIGSFGSTANTGWAVFALMLEATGTGSIWSGGDGCNGMALSIDSGGKLEWAMGDGSNDLAILTTDEAVDLSKGVVAVLNWDYPANNSFVIAGGKLIDTTISSPIGSPTSGDFTGARLGDAEQSLNVSEGALEMQASFVAGVARSSAISEATARKIWAAMQAPANRNPKITATGHLEHLGHLG